MRSPRGDARAPLVAAAPTTSLQSAPRLCRLSDRQVVVLLALHICTVLICTVVSIAEPFVVHSYKVAPEQTCSGPSPLSLGYCVKADTQAPYVGLSLFGPEGAIVDLDIAGVACTSGSVHFSGNTTLTGHGPAFRLALVHPVLCQQYSISIHIDDHNSAVPTEPYLLVEAQLGSIALLARDIRGILVSAFTLLSICSLVQWFRAAANSSTTMCSFATLYVNVAVICYCDPVDLLLPRAYVSGRWYFLRSTGVKMYEWYLLRFIGGLLADLNKSPPSLVPAPGSNLPDHQRCFSKVGKYLWQRVFCGCKCSSHRKYRVGVAFIEFVFFLALPSAFHIMLSQSIGDSYSHQLGPIFLADDWNTIVDFRYGSQIVMFFNTVVAVQAWIIFRMFELGFSFRNFPYSHCRLHYITWSFNTVLVIAGECFLASFVVNEFRLQDHDRVSPWFHLNNVFFGLLLPGAQNVFADDAIVLAVYAFVTAVAFGPCLAPVAATRTLPLTGEASGPSTQAQDEAFACPCCMSVEASPRGEPSLPMATSPPRKHKRRRFRRQRAQSFPDETDVGVPLSTVRLLAHCACAVYDEVEELKTGKLKQPQTEDEADLHLSTLELYTVLEDEEDLDVRALVATIGNVGIVAFRGTASPKNVRTDFKFAMKPVEGTLMAELAVDKGVEGILVHNGFLQAMRALYPALQTAIGQLRCSVVWFTGHSLGGALATLMASELHLAHQRAGQKVALCTFGSPPVGNRAFAQLFRHSACKSIRVVLDLDPVPSSLKLQVRYAHVSGLVRVYHNGHLVIRPSFLEESIRWLLWHLSITNIVCCPCLCVWRAPSHLGFSYIAALRSAQRLEAEASVPGTESLRISTSYLPMWIRGAGQRRRTNTSSGDGSQTSESVMPSFLRSSGHSQQSGTAMLADAMQTGEFSEPTSLGLKRVRPSASPSCASVPETHAESPLAANGTHVDIPLDLDSSDGQRRSLDLDSSDSLRRIATKAVAVSSTDQV